MNKNPDWLDPPFVGAIIAFIAAPFVIAFLPDSIGRTIIGMAWMILMVMMFGPKFLWYFPLTVIAFAVLVSCFKSWGH